MKADFQLNKGKKIKITEITASFGATKQVAPYEPVNFHASIKAEVSSSLSQEELQEIEAELFSQAKRSVKSQILELKKKKVTTKNNIIQKNGLQHLAKV